GAARGQLEAGVVGAVEAVAAPPAPRAVPGTRLDVRGGGPEEGIRLLEPPPRLERQQRLGGARRARIERHDPAEGRVEEEEGDANGNLERVPLGLAERERGRVEMAVRHGAEPALRGALAREEEVARPAGAEQVAALDVHDVRVLVGDRRRAHVAALTGDGLALLVEQPAQHADGRGRRSLLLRGALLLAHAVPPTATSMPVSRWR